MTATPDPTPADRRVLAYLTTCYAVVSTSGIARDTGLPYDTVRTALRELVRDGDVERAGTRGGNIVYRAVDKPPTHMDAVAAAIMGVEWPDNVEDPEPPEWSPDWPAWALRDLERRAKRIADQPADKGGTPAFRREPARVPWFDWVHDIDLRRLAGVVSTYVVAWVVGVAVIAGVTGLLAALIWGVVQIVS